MSTCAVSLILQVCMLHTLGSLVKTVQQKGQEKNRCNGIHNIVTTWFAILA